MDRGVEGQRGRGVEGSKHAHNTHAHRLPPPPPLALLSVTPTTLLLHDAAAEYCAFVREEEAGHSALLRCALRRKEQVAYLWAEDVTDPASGARVVRVFTEAVDVEPGEAW